MLSKNKQPHFSTFLAYTYVPKLTFVRFVFSFLFNEPFLNLDVNDFTWGSKPSSAIRPTPYRTWQEQGQVDAFAGIIVWRIYWNIQIFEYLSGHSCWCFYFLNHLPCLHCGLRPWYQSSGGPDQIPERLNSLHDIITMKDQTPYFEPMDPCETFVQDLKW